jgi:hypothetical protein
MQVDGDGSTQLDAETDAAETRNARRKGIRRAQIERP